MSRGCLKPRAMGRDSVGRSWTIAAGRQISLRQERPLHTAVKPSADEVPLGWGVPDGRRVLMGCHEPLAGSGGAVRSIGGVWFGANRGMPAGMSRCSMLCHGWAGGVRGCRGVVTSGAKRGGTGEMRCDELCTSADVGTLGQRVERAYGDWLSAAVVGIVAWRCWGNDREKP